MGPKYCILMSSILLNSGGQIITNYSVFLVLKTNPFLGQLSATPRHTEASFFIISSFCLYNNKILDGAR